MQKLSIHQSLQQKLSPQQIQFIKLLQIPTAELNARIQEELEENPVLEEGKEEKEEKEKDEKDDENSNDESEDSYEDDYDFDGNDSQDVNIGEYLQDDSGYKMQGDGNNGQEEDDKEMPIAMYEDLIDSLEMQLGYIKLAPKDEIIAHQLIGSIDEDGYIRRDLALIVNDLAFAQNIETNIKEIEKVLHKIQNFEPAGIAARNLSECLLLQLERKHQEEAQTPEEHKQIDIAISIIEHHFVEFTKKHYDKIEKKLNLNDAQLKKIVAMITHLNPKPGDTSGGNYSGTQYIIPDFILTKNGSKLELSLNSRNAPELKISRAYAEMLDTYDKSDKKDKVVKETVDAAKWFIDAIKQRQNTLMKTMEAILQFQYEFFLHEDENKFRPMILKDIAERIDMDISTVSRVANSKSIQTEFGMFPLKYFFSEGIATDSGEDASSREVKSHLKEFVDNENKKKPLSDDRLEEMLNEAGYQIARRTVAKYREQLGISVARLRKEL
jgi:RNA polymerase sigma-54 factor